MNFVTPAPGGAPAHKLFPVTAKRVELVAPHMKRIMIDGSALGRIRPDLPAQWLKVFPTSHDEMRLSGRAYTIRSYDPRTNDIALDFFLHGRRGPASAFAEDAKAGVEFHISAPHPRSGYTILPSTNKYLLFGDETSLSAIAGILEALPARCSAYAFLEIADGTEEQRIESAANAQINWIHRRNSLSNGYELEAAAWGITAIGQDTAIFAAGESSAIVNIRKYFQIGHKVQKTLVDATGYWKKGEQDHRDPFAI